MPAKAMVPEEQWRLPVCIGSEGQLISLKEALSKPLALSFAQLTPAQQAELVATRIEMQPKFELAMIGAGIVDKTRAIQEVRAQTPVGRTLIEIEQRVITRMLERAQQANP